MMPGGFPWPAGASCAMTPGRRPGSKPERSLARLRTRRNGLLAQEWSQTGRARPQAVLGPLLDVVTDMAFSSKEWYAATNRGLLVSTDRGATWTLKPVGPLTSLPVQSVRVSSNGERIRVVSLRGLVFSDDGGNSWTWHDLPLNSGGAVTLDAQPGDENTLVAIAHNGLYISRDAGNNLAASGLRACPRLPCRTLPRPAAVFVASMRTGGLYVSSDSGRTWDRVPGTLADGFFAAVTPSNRARA